MMISRVVKKTYRKINECIHSVKRRIPSYVAFLLCLIGYSLSTFYVFYIVYSIHPVKYIDEIFHVPQARNYCAFNFTHWDRKITTLPGLYLYTVAFLSPVSYFFGEDVCNLFILRSVNVFTSILTFGLIYHSFKFIYKNIAVQHDIVLWSTVNISFFPVLYFFNFLYYTDVVSVFFVLLSYHYHVRRRYSKSSFFGILSVLMRQTNIVWVGFMFLDVMNDFFSVIFGKSGLKTMSLRRYIELTLLKFNRSKFLFIKTLLVTKGYIMVCSLFLLFVYVNKAIVVGDRFSHQAVIHVPQLFYFSLFCTFFSFPFALKNIKPFLNFSKHYWKYMLPLTLIATSLVHFNSLVHPYLLADNRHYTFYLWKIYQKYELLKYLLVPCYMFCIFNITSNLSHMRFSFPLVYWLCVSVLVIPQKLLEFRYFILPYLIYRLNLKPVYRWHLFVESIMYFTVNYLVINVFVNKEFYWSDSADVQRIGW